MWEEKPVLTTSDIAKATGWVSGAARTFAEEVAPIYRLLGWSWWNGEGPEKTPTVEQIEQTLNELAELAGRDSVGKPWMSANSGGLTVGISREDEGLGIAVTIAFAKDVREYLE